MEFWDSMVAWRQTRIGKRVWKQMLKVPWVLGKLHDIGDIFQKNLQKPLAMCQSNSISSPEHLNLAANMKQKSNIEAYDYRLKVLNHWMSIIITFFFTILTISLNMSRSTISWWTTSPQFLLSVSSTWKRKPEYQLKKINMNISKTMYDVHTFFET